MPSVGTSDPKLDRYSSHLFMACHAIGLDADTAEMHVAEIDIFIGDRWIITARKANRFDIAQVAEALRADAGRDDQRRGLRALRCSIR